jgi:hypothetical protein
VEDVMRTLDLIRAATVVGILVVAACGGDDDGGGGGEGAASSTGTAGAGTGGTGTGGGAMVQNVRVSGTVVDFETLMPIAGSATVTTTALEPPPTISVTGAEFTLENVPPFSVFHLLAGAPPEYRNTYNTATETTDMDVAGVQAPILKETYIATLNSAFGVTPAGGTGILVARLVDEAGMPRAGVPGNVLTLNGAQPPIAPFFLDANKAPDPQANATSASGYVVFYNVPPGLVTLGAEEGGGWTITAASAPVAAAVVTLADGLAGMGGPILPVNVSFSTDVVPIFSARGCANCHTTGNAPGDLQLSGGENTIYQELVQEISPKFNVVRVNLGMPAQSLILTMPSLDVEPDSHPNATFISQNDPDYLKIRVWIEEGALQN